MLLQGWSRTALQPQGDSRCCCDSCYTAILVFLAFAFCGTVTAVVFVAVLHRLRYRFGCSLLFLLVLVAAARLRQRSLAIILSSGKNMRTQASNQASKYVMNTYVLSVCLLVCLATQKSSLGATCTCTILYVHMLYTYIYIQYIYMYTYVNVHVCVCVLCVCVRVSVSLFVCVRAWLGSHRRPACQKWDTF